MAKRRKDGERHPYRGAVPFSAWCGSIPSFMILHELPQDRAAPSPPPRPFGCPPPTPFAGLENYVQRHCLQMDFLPVFGVQSCSSPFPSVALILLCCSMCAWYITRVKGTPEPRALCTCFVLSMVVPFQMVMFTLSKTADPLKLNTPWNICIIYLGFGAGLAVFMFYRLCEERCRWRSRRPP